MGFPANPILANKLMAFGLSSSEANLIANDLGAVYVIPATGTTTSGGDPIWGSIATPSAAALANTTATFIRNTDNSRWVVDSAGTGLVPLSTSTSSQTVPPAPLAPFVVGLETAPLAQAGNASATVTWAAPASQPATSYTVTASPGGASVTISAAPITLGATQSATVTGLTNGTAYTFTVTATNLYGTSLPSVASTSVTPTAYPSSILPVTAGLVFWFSASNTNGHSYSGTVTTLIDQSGNGFNAVGSATWVASWSNGKPAISFNGTANQKYVLPIYQGFFGPSMTVYIVFDCTANPNAYSVLNGAIWTTMAVDNSETWTELSHMGNSLSVGSTASNCLVTVNERIGINRTPYETYSATGPGLSAPSYITLTMPGGLRVGGSAVTGQVGPMANAGAVSKYYPAQRKPYFNLGGPDALGNSTLAFEGHIAEVVMFNTVHTPAQIALMETYLSGLF